MIGISNIIKKDIENLQQYFRRADRLAVKKEEECGDQLPNHQDTSTVATLPIVIPNLALPDTSSNHHQFTFVEQKNILY